MNSRTVALTFLLLASPAWAQSVEDGIVLKWETRPYSQSAHIIRNHIVYSVQIGTAVFQIARRSDKQEMASGEHIRCRIDGGHAFVSNAKGKETKYDIVGSGRAPDSPAR
jgi:hypothetical protein